MIDAEKIYWSGLVLQGRDDPIDEEQVNRCRIFACMLVKSKTLNRRVTSYQLKCHVEQGGAYISNGAFIKAMILEGFRAEPYKHGSTDVVFNIAKNYFKDVEMFSKAKDRIRK